MTALSANRATKQFSAETVPAYLPSGGVAASTTIYAGSIACIDSAGRYTKASADPALRVVGLFEESYDNGSGAAGAVTAYKIRRGAFCLANSSSTDALTAADIGRLCYAADDQTVARTSGAGTRPVAGRVLGLEGTEVIVELGFESDPSAIEVYCTAGADLSAKQYYFVKQHSTAGQCVVAGAGEAALGILQNAPASGAIARVRMFGRSRLVAGAAISIADPVASGAAGKGKTAVKASTNTSDAGGATDALVGSNVMAIAESEATTDGDVIAVVLTHAGAVPTTAS